MKTTAYVYKWTHIPTLRWYVGSRTARGCHPDDGYICSSKTVKPLILANRNEWSRQIIETGSVENMLVLETEILKLANAKDDPRSFNMHHGDGRFTTAGKKLAPFTSTHLTRMSEAFKGRDNYWARGKPSWNSGKSGIFTHSEEWRKQASERQRGKKNHMFGRTGELNPNFGKKNPALGLKIKSIRQEKYWASARCSCMLCRKEVSVSTLEHHRSSSQCADYKRPRMCCISCYTEMWTSSIHNHIRLNRCNINPTPLMHQTSK